MTVLNTYLFPINKKSMKGKSVKGTLRSGQAASSFPKVNILCLNCKAEQIYGSSDTKTSNFQ